MKKLKLDVDELIVEGFGAAAAVREPLGTVEAHDNNKTLPLDQCFSSIVPTCSIYC
ncbi:MAG: hypothetical protein KY467_14305 [Gemmatimonadetes bacterium]|nr:hypothetical protein [Gemmatimonadota bacterium]